MKSRKRFRNSENQETNVRQEDRNLAWSDLVLPAKQKKIQIIKTIQNNAGLSSTLNLEIEKFPTDFHLLQHRHNLLFFGLGSKKHILELFARAIRQFEINLDQKPSCVLTIDGSIKWLGKGLINGLHQALKKILNLYLRQHIDTITGQSIERISARIRSILTLLYACRRFPRNSPKRHNGDLASVAVDAPAWDRDLYLFIHNIDGESMRIPAAREAIARLAEAPGIHIVSLSFQFSTIKKLSFM